MAGNSRTGSLVAAALAAVATGSLLLFSLVAQRAATTASKGEAPLAVESAGASGYTVTLPGPRARDSQSESAIGPREAPLLSSILAGLTGAPVSPPAGLVDAAPSLAPTLPRSRQPRTATGSQELPPVGSVPPPEDDRLTRPDEPTLAARPNEPCRSAQRFKKRPASFPWRLERGYPSPVGQRRAGRAAPPGWRGKEAFHPPGLRSTRCLTERSHAEHSHGRPQWAHSRNPQDQAGPKRHSRSEQKSATRRAGRSNHRRNKRPDATRSSRKGGRSSASAPLDMPAPHYSGDGGSRFGQGPDSGRARDPGRGHARGRARGHSKPRARHGKH